MRGKKTDSSFNPITRDEDPTHNILHDNKKRTATPDTEISDTVSQDSITPDLSEVNLPCEQKAFLSKGEARDTVFSQTNTGDDSNLYAHFIDIIKQEIIYRKANTPVWIGYKPGPLNELIEALENCGDDVDIKEMVRLHLNSAELEASDKSMALNMVWEDIRAKLNQELGFQPQEARRHEKTVITDRTPKTFMGKLFSEKRPTSPYADREGKYARERIREQHHNIRRVLDSLIEEQGGEVKEDIHTKRFGNNS
jgi:hypothetical protein